MTSPSLPIAVPSLLSLTVGSLARTLQATDSGELEIEVPSGAALDLSAATGVSIEAGKLRFARLEDRNAAVAADVFNELGGAVDAERVWTAARNLWGHEIGSADMASGRLLALAHPHFNALQLATAHISSQNDVFDALHLVEATLPYLEAIHLPDLVRLCDAEQPLTKSDLAGGMFYGVLNRWFVRNQAAAREMVELLLTDLNMSRGNLLGAAWLAWFNGDPQTSVQRLLDVERRPGLAVYHGATCWIASRMLLEPTVRTDLSSALETLIENRIYDGDAVRRRAGLLAASALLPFRRAFDAALRARIAEGDQDAVGFVMQSLARNRAALLESGTFFDWLRLGVSLSEGYEGVLDELDHCLSRLLGADSAHAESVISFIENWIQAHSAVNTESNEFAQRFDQCVYAILSHPELLGRVFTRWMLAESQAFAGAAADLVMKARVEVLPMVELDRSLLENASDSDLRYLCKRTLGFLVDAKQTLSVALSLLRLRDAKARVLHLLRWLLYEEIGYDYPGTTITVLRARALVEEDAEVKELLTEIAAQLEADLSTLEGLPRLRELAVPQPLRRDFAKARDKAMAHSIREAHKHSILAQLASQVHIKAGEATFQYMNESFSEPMGFASHSVGFELPRREVLDPVGNAFRRLRFRTVKRGQP